MADLVGPDDVRAATDAVVAALEPAVDNPEWWGAPAGALRWSCTTTLIHIVDCFVWYAASLARRSTAGISVSESQSDRRPDVLVDSVRSGGALLAIAVAPAGPHDRGWHLFGSTDRSGWAAMGVDEVLIHGADIAAGLGVSSGTLRRRGRRRRPPPLSRGRQPTATPGRGCCGPTGGPRSAISRRRDDGVFTARPCRVGRRGPHARREAAAAPQA